MSCTFRPTSWINIGLEPILCQQTKVSVHSNSWRLNRLLWIFYLVAEQWPWKHPGELQHQLGQRRVAAQQAITATTRKHNNLDNKVHKQRAWSQLRYVVWGTLDNKDCNGTWDRIANRRCSRSRRHSINTQAETKAPNIRWKLCNIWRVEVHVFSIHGPAGQHSSTTASKSGKSNNSAYRCRAARCSNNTWRRREVDRTVQQPQVHTHQHHLRCSSNSLQATPLQYLLEQGALVLTKFLKQKIDNNNFEESFSTWELELARYERGNNA